MEVQQQEGQRVRGILVHLGWFVVGALPFLIIMLVLYVFQVRSIAEVRATHRQLDQEREGLGPFIDRVEQLEAFRNLLRIKTDIVADLQRHDPGLAGLLALFSQTIPEAVWLTEMRVEQHTFVFQAATLDEAEFFSWLRVLGGLPDFQGTPPAVLAVESLHQGQSSFLVTFSLRRAESVTRGR